MGRDSDFRDGGIASFFELIGNGSNKATVHAPDVLAGDYDLELFDALPGSTSVVTIDATGKLSFTGSGAGTLDDSYDFGGAGAGRIITGDNGPVEVQGAGGFLSSHSAPLYGLETTGLEYNFRVTAGQTADIFEIQRGDQDADISDDTFDALFALDGANRRLGLNTVAPGTLVHLVSPSGDATVTVECPAASDPSLIFTENSIARWQAGYDQSAGGFLLSGTAFGTLDALFVEDTTGDVGIGVLAPLARLHAKSASTLTGLIESTTTGARLGLKDATTTNENVVGIEATGDAMEIQAGTSITLISGSGGDIVLDAAASAEVQMPNTTCRIASTLLGAPLLILDPVTGNSRGDFQLVPDRTADPSSPSEGDFWYNATDELLRFRDGSTKTLECGTNTFQVVADPGDGNTITPPGNCNFVCEFTNSTGSQTRGLGSPAFVGQRAILYALFSGAGTDTAITEPSGTGWLGGGTADDVATFNTSGEYVEAVAISATEWRASSSAGISYS